MQLSNTSLRAKIEGFPDLPAGWRERIVPLSSTGGVALSARVWSKLTGERDPKRVCVIIHGFGEHSGRYRHVPYYLQNEFDCFVAPDLRGHGLSEGPRGYCASFNDYVEDVRCGLLWLESEVGDAKPEFHLIAHSMGGLVAIHWLRSGAPAFLSVSISAPLLGVKVQVPWFKVLAAKLLAPIWGSLPLASEVDVGKLSHDPAVAEAHARDPHVHSKATPRGFMEMLRAIRTAHSDIHKIEIPTLVLLPQSDEVVSSSQTQSWFDQLECSKKKIVPFEGMYHEILNETVKDRAFEEVRQWVIQNTRR